MWFSFVVYNIYNKIIFNMILKTCSKCKISKELIYFSKNKNSIDKFEPRCKKNARSNIKIVLKINRKYILENIIY